MNNNNKWRSNMLKSLSVEQLKDNLEFFYYDHVDAGDMTDGLYWYQDANKWIQEDIMKKYYWLNTWQVAQITALISPQNPWEANKRQVESLMEGTRKGVFASRKTLLEVIGILNEEFVIPEERMKTHSFAQNLSDPSNPNFVTIDRHAIKVAYYDLDAKPISITKKRYKDTREAYIALSKDLGLIPCQLQAILWVAYKRVVNR